MLEIAFAVVAASIRIDRYQKAETRLTAIVGSVILAGMRDWKVPGDQ